MGKEVTITLKKPLILKEKMHLFIDSINEQVRFQLEFYKDKTTHSPYTEYTIYSHKYLHERSKRDNVIYISSNYDDARLFISYIREAINTEELTVFIRISECGANEKKLTLKNVLASAK